MPDARSMRAGASRVLVVEDDPGMREVLIDELTEQGHSAFPVAGVAEALTALPRLEPELVLTDLRLLDGPGTEVLRASREMNPPPGVIIITGFGSIAEAVEALKMGADEFLTKPLDLEHLRMRVQRILDVQRLKRLVQMESEGGAFHGMVGRSPVMLRLFDEIRIVAKTNAHVLVVGESGVGKERVARALHEESERRKGPFVAVNCAAIPTALVESELFGHAAGAFTGAQRERRGLFEEARGGSLLLDELTELPLGAQAKLLRTLQEASIRPVGSNREVGVDTRIVATTNCNVEEEVRAGRFREDLYYRLETFVLNVPPMRERRDDIELLIARFAERLRARAEHAVEGFCPEAVEALRAYDYPGNVRQLENIVERAVAFCRGGLVRPEHLGDRVTEHFRRARPAQKMMSQLLPEGELPTLQALEQTYIEHVLERVGGNKRQAASILGIGRRTLYRRLDGDAGEARHEPPTE